MNATKRYNGLPLARPGISRIDLLVILGIVALIGVNLIPAIGHVRESARRVQCADRLRKIGTALGSYHDNYDVLPPAAIWSSEGLTYDEDGRLERSPLSIKATHANWLQLLLPYLDQTHVASKFDNGQPVTAVANEAARLQRPEVFACPSDTFNTPENPYRLEFSDGTSCEFARGNYGINGGTHVGAEYPGYLAYPIATGNVIVDPGPENNEFQWWGTGVAGFNRCFSYDDFQNGLSTLVAVDELRAGIIPEDQRGAWALGQIGSSATWAHGVHGDAFGPNSQVPNSDDILGGKDLYHRLGHEQFLAEKMPFCDHCSLSNQATARSLHPSGVNALMVDGSVHFISDSVNPSLWHVMHSRDTPQEALDEDLTIAFDGMTDYEEADDLQTSHSDLDFDAESLENSIGMEFVRVPTGAFLMGQPDNGNTWPYPEEAVPHRVNITRAFYLGVCEVTQGQFSDVMGTNPSWHQSNGEGRQRVVGTNTAAFSVENVSWDDAVRFCRDLSERTNEKSMGRIYRLPTEAEWEHACRAGSESAATFHPMWDAEDDSGIIAGKDRPTSDEYAIPKPVGSYAANSFGLYDMRGNVFEWCNDWFSRDYYSRSPVNDPQGPSTGYLKIVRGWDWIFVGNHCKDYLCVAEPWRKSRYIGFRVVCEVTASRD